jgi:hypothetical protein
MAPFVSQILVVHIAFAVGCALMFWPPLFLAKGGRAHVLIGKLYGLLLVAMTITALAVTVISFVEAAEAATRPTTGMLLDPYRSNTTVYRIHLGFLAFVAIGTIQAFAFGMGALRATPSRVGAWVHVFLATVGLAVIGAGLYLAYLPMIVVGLVGAAMGFYFATRCHRASQADRLADHLTGLIASGVLSYTAIAIVVANRVMHDFFHGPYGITVWVLPTLLGLPSILLMRREHGSAVR